MPVWSSQTDLFLDMSGQKETNAQSFYTPRNEVVGGYTGFAMSVRPSVDKSYVVW
jgi:hypothetical protein